MDTRASMEFPSLSSLLHYISFFTLFIFMYKCCFCFFLTYSLSARNLSRMKAQPLGPDSTRDLRVPDIVDT